MECDCVDTAIKCIKALGMESSVDVKDIRQKLTARQFILPDTLANTAFAYWMLEHHRGR